MCKKVARAFFVFRRARQLQALFCEATVLTPPAHLREPSAAFCGNAKRAPGVPRPLTAGGFSFGPPSAGSRVPFVVWRGFFFKIIQVVGYATFRAGGGLTTPHAILDSSRKRERAMGAAMPFSKFDVDPRHIEAMRAAFRRVCDLLQLDCGRDDPMTELVVTKIVELAKGGELDPGRLCIGVLAQLGTPLPSVEDEGVTLRGAAPSAAKTAGPDVQTIFGPNDGTSVSAGQRSTFMIVSCRH
jgi:hypothetical protein